MKKNLIALTVAVSAAVSGSAMAWTANGTGGSVELSGTLTPADAVTPWEVRVGDAVANLDAVIQKKTKVVDVAVNKPIPFLGIRNIQSQPFQGINGVSPQIDFGGAVDLDAFVNNRAPVTLEVKDNNGGKIGTLTASMGASAREAIKASPDKPKDFNGINDCYANVPGSAFFGGLPKVINNISHEDIAFNVMPEILDHFNQQGLSYRTEDTGACSWMNNLTSTYSAYYAAGIEQGQSIRITLDQPAESDVIVWNASLPVTVTYQ